MKFFDVFLPIGRTNLGFSQSPCDVGQAEAVMDRYDIDQALVYNVVSRDSDMEMGNTAIAEMLAKTPSGRLHMIWGFDPAYVITESPEIFLNRALANHVKAFVVNPNARKVRIDRSLRLAGLAALLEKRRIPLIIAPRQWEVQQDIIDWYLLSDFCQKYPALPVICHEWRARSNRPMFDALAETQNLTVAISGLWQTMIVEQIVTSFGASRLVFSSGLPTLDPGAFQGTINYANISEDQKLAIANGNITKMLQEADYEA